MPESTEFEPLGSGFFDRDPATVARALLGKVLVSRVEGVEAGGVIVETEAYLGADDPGSHAATKGVTARNAVMYGPPGMVYVYFTYGVHHMVNLVCEAEGVAGAVLIRALEPTRGVEMMSRRRQGRTGREIASGPGKVASALGVDLSDNGTKLGAGRLTVYDSPEVASDRIAVSGRIGLSSGCDLPLRYYVHGSGYVSKGREGHRSSPRRRGVGTAIRRRAGSGAKHETQ